MAFRIIETCIGCTACVKRCPTDAITGERKMLHVIDPDLCIDCGACGVVCPAEAILDGEGVVQPMLKKNERPVAFVDEVACTGCNKCEERCPFDCLYLVPTVNQSSTYFEVMEVDQETCVGCKECEKACPYDAIFIYRKDSVPAWLLESKVEKGEPTGRVDRVA
jgi:Na+-translocating ferredoxin:NAD+ oxidoreductase subunit B